MKAIDTTVQESKHISITDVARQVRADSEHQDPVLRELELNAMLRICDLMSQTGVIRIPAIVHGCILAERDRVAILVNQATKPDPITESEVRNRR